MKAAAPSRTNTLLSFCWIFTARCIRSGLSTTGPKARADINYSYLGKHRGYLCIVVRGWNNRRSFAAHIPLLSSPHSTLPPIFSLFAFFLFPSFARDPPHRTAARCLSISPHESLDPCVTQAHAHAGRGPLFSINRCCLLLEAKLRPARQTCFVGATGKICSAR